MCGFRSREFRLRSREFRARAREFRAQARVKAPFPRLSRGKGAFTRERGYSATSSIAEVPREPGFPYRSQTSFRRIRPSGRNSGVLVLCPEIT